MQFSVHGTWSHFRAAILRSNSSGPLITYACQSVCLLDKTDFSSKVNVSIRTKHIWMAAHANNSTVCSVSTVLPKSVHKTSLIWVRYPLTSRRGRSGVGCPPEACTGQPEWGRVSLFPARFLPLFILTSLFVFPWFLLSLLFPDISVLTVHTLIALSHLVPTSLRRCTRSTPNHSTWHNALQSGTRTSSLLRTSVSWCRYRSTEQHARAIPVPAAPSRISKWQLPWLTQTKGLSASIRRISLPHIHSSRLP